MRIQRSFLILLIVCFGCFPSHAQMGHLTTVDTIVATRASASVIHGNYLYMHSWDGPLDIFDLANPAAPALVNSVDVGFGYYGRLGHHRDKLFVYDIGTHFLRMIDISDPVNPFITDSLLVPSVPNSLRGASMTHTATHTYFADYDTLYTINTADSSNLFMESKFASPQIGSLGYGELVAFDTALYVSNGGNIQIFNISNPGQPDYSAAMAPHYTDRIVEVWHLRVNPTDSLLYLGDWNFGHGHQAYDITNPLWPQYRFRGTGSSAHNNFSYGGNLIAQIIDGGGICVFYTDKDSSTLIDTLILSMSPSGFLFDLDLKNNYIYVTNPNGLEVVHLDTGLVGTTEFSTLSVDFIAYPNPTTDFVHVHLAPTQKGMTLELCNLQGQLIRELQVVQNGEATKVDMRDLAKGVYWLGLRGNGERLGGKMVVRW